MANPEYKVLVVYRVTNGGCDNIIRRMLWILCEAGIPIRLSHNRILQHSIVACIPADLPRYMLDVEYWRERALASEIALETFNEGCA